MTAMSSDRGYQLQMSVSLEKYVFDQEFVLVSTTIFRMDSDSVFIAEICISAKTDLVVKNGYFSALFNGSEKFGHLTFKV